MISKFLLSLLVGMACIQLAKPDGAGHHHSHHHAPNAHHEQHLAHSSHEHSSSSHSSSNIVSSYGPPQPAAASNSNGHQHNHHHPSYAPAPVHKYRPQPENSIVSFFRRLAGGLVALKGGLIKGHAAFWDAKGNALINVGKKISGRPPYGPEYKPEPVNKPVPYHPH